MFIYCIEDINDLKYIGSTSRDLNTRLTEHRYKKRNNLSCSSKKLNLYNCIIYLLEECKDEERLEREKYYIENTECVNEIKYTGRNHNLNQRKYYHKNIDKMREYYRNFYKNKAKQL
jgi:predicted GIY-YIG superfamily endonuclease